MLMCMIVQLACVQDVYDGVIWKEFLENTVDTSVPFLSNLCDIVILIVFDVSRSIRIGEHNRGNEGGMSEVGRQYVYGNLGKIEEYDGATEDWTTYMERLEIYTVLYLDANEVTYVKRRDVFLTYTYTTRETELVHVPLAVTLGSYLSRYFYKAYMCTKVHTCTHTHTHTHTIQRLGLYYLQ